MTTLNKTDSRLIALREVNSGVISYDPRSGTYSDADGYSVSGARRRTFAELRAAGVIAGGTPVELTDSGRTLIDDWS
jgi:hypothetical protein